MEFSLSGNALKTFTRSIISLARIGTDLVIQGSPSQMALHTINSSRTAYQSVTFKPDFFDAFTLLHHTNSNNSPIQCSLLLKSVCSLFRTPISNLDQLSALLPSQDAPKLQWTLHCRNGAKKTYWISCNVDPDIEQLSIDKGRFPSSFVVSPRDLTRLLSNFQSSLQEITVIATDPSAVPSDAAGEIGGKAVELRSYIDPTKDGSENSTLHTQLWIDPAEEFVQYRHTGDAVDFTFGIRELKAFLSFCEACEVDIHLFFEKAGVPILMAPRFGFSDGLDSDFDATLVLATMLASQLTEVNAAVEPLQANVSQSQRARGGATAANSDHPSDHTKIWSDLSGNGARSSGSNADGPARTEANPSTRARNGEQVPDRMNPSKAPTSRPEAPDVGESMGRDHLEEDGDGSEMVGNRNSQHHPSNWVGIGDDEKEDDDDDGELIVQSTPQF